MSLAAILLWLATLHAQPGMATRFGDPGDPADAFVFACQRRMPSSTFRKIKPSGCAHRTLPCGTPILVEKEGRVTVCYVIDRGPYGKRRDGRWRGVIDLTPPVANRLGVSRNPVTLYYWSTP